MDWGAEYVGIVLLAVAGLLAYWKQKRKFDRTNQYGVEQFPSYGRKVRARTMEGLLAFGSLALLTTGVLILGFRFEDSWGWVVTVPVYLVALYALIGW
jgi:hypothetical protein